ncbi:HAD-like protein [Abortiporus biennis]|nr:HAD-like protein [Abortiporus biennis]
MTSPHLKAVIFDIGGVVCRSPLIAIAQYEREHGVPTNYINCSITRRGSNGSWQKFERGEISLFPFYESFGRELSDTERGNVWYTEYCNRKGIPIPKLPDKLNIDGRDLFGRMMRESGTFDERVVEAIRRIRLAGRWRIIALTNNFSKSDAAIMEEASSKATGTFIPTASSTISSTSTAAAGTRIVAETENQPNTTINIQTELAFLGWQEGVTPLKLRSMFDDFCDSSALGMRKPEPEFYLLACKRNGIEPRQAVFLDDLGMNLKAAQRLGMETIHVPIGGSLGALKELEKKLGIDLTSGFEPTEWLPSKM